jgi:hypothetical protein
MKGQLAESYSGYDSSVTQLPANMSHDPDADFPCWCFREMVIAAAAAAAVHAARSAATMAAAITARRDAIIPILRRAMGVRIGKVLVTARSGKCEGGGAAICKVEAAVQSWLIW